MQDLIPSVPNFRMSPSTTRYRGECRWTLSPCYLYGPSPVKTGPPLGLVSGADLQSSHLCYPHSPILFCCGRRLMWLQYCGWGSDRLCTTPLALPGPTLLDLQFIPRYPHSSTSRHFHDRTNLSGLDKNVTTGAFGKGFITGDLSIHLKDHPCLFRNSRWQNTSNQKIGQTSTFQQIC